MVRKTVHYRGRVQGVGFRFTAQRIARQFNVSGYVMNLPDGRVELVAEGEPDEVDRFLADVGRAMEGCIRDVQAEMSKANGAFTGFGLRY